MTLSTGQSKGQAADQIRDHRAAQLTASQARRLFFQLYFFEGAPIGLIWWAIPTLMAARGVTVDVITSLTAMATLPWTFKFLLGPVVDRYFFTVRAYALSVAVFQLGMLLGLLVMLMSSLDSPSFTWIIVGVSLSSAIQDVFIDAWAIGIVPDDERGRINGAMQAGLLSGRWLFGAGFLIVLSYISWKLTVGALCFLILLSILSLVFRFVNNPLVINPSQANLTFNSFAFIFKFKFLLLALIAVLSGFAFESLGAVAGPYFIANGFAKVQVGFIMSATLASMLLGSVLGGLRADQKGARRVFIESGLVLSLLVMLLGGLSLSGLSILLISLSCLAYFFIGTFTASSYSFYMGQAKGPMEATRFTFLMAMTNLCESAAGFSIGRVVAVSVSGYLAGFVTTSLISLVGILILWRGFSTSSFAESAKS